ncbi:MAG: hypothetical protein IPK50_14545 [Fibrobacterota bacterium]|nr:hypothetical protein [Fibrobacterota bacterium]QQS03515.1 MAG: hypothetical protein IPK50_14545 [Fibrobacterota bacterium]
MDHVIERKDIKKFILQKIRKFAETEHDPVRFVQVGYDIDQSKLLCVYFNTRPKAGPDGLWTTNLKGNSKNISKWKMFEDGDYDELVPLVGELIKECLLELRAEGAFELIHSARNADFGIEHMMGDYGWPDYEDRKKENLLRPKK